MSDLKLQTELAGTLFQLWNIVTEQTVALIRRVRKGGRDEHADLQRGKQGYQPPKKTNLSIQCVCGAQKNAKNAHANGASDIRGVVGEVEKTQGMGKKRVGAKECVRQRKWDKNHLQMSFHHRQHPPRVNYGTSKSGYTSTLHLSMLR